MIAPENSLKDKVDVLADKDIDSLDSDVRYMTYGCLRTALRASTRYITYVRSIGFEGPTSVALTDFLQ